MTDPPIRAAAGGERGGYGWIPDLPDTRDKLAKFDDQALGSAASTPSVDLSGDPSMPPIWNQRRLGSCTAQSVCGAFVFAKAKLNPTDPMFDPSHLFVYYWERVMIGTVDTDSGAMIRDGFKVINKIGVAPNDDWPYVVETFEGPPPEGSVQHALEAQSLLYQRLHKDLVTLKAALVLGYPFSFGFSVYESMLSDEVAETGVVPMPDRDEEVLGGHAVLGVGYDDSSERFLVRNSWGEEWGLPDNPGYCTMPYEFVTGPSASDMWMVTVTE